jgi:hypothetical protein
MKKKWPFFLTTLPFSYSLFLLCAALDSCCIIYLTKERFLLFLKKGIMCWENPFDRPYYIRLKRIKKEKRTCSVWKHPLAWGENHVRYIPNVIWNSRWPRVANESTASHPPLLHFLFTPPTCILLLGPLTDFCGLKLHRIFFLHATTAKRFFLSK